MDLKETAHKFIMRIIFAVIDGGSNPEYNKMRDIWLNYKHEVGTEVIFLRSSPLIVKTIYDTNTSTLWAPGEESLMPGVLHKTHEAIKYLTSEFGVFDYFVRTNLSSLFDYNVMVKWLRQNPLDYGGKLENAFDEWEFASGSGIYLSWKGCETFLEHFPEMAQEYDLPEDVVIGKVMQKYVSMTYVPRITFSYCEDPEILELLTNDYREIFHYRCHSDEQHVKTVEYMELIYKKIVYESS